MTLSFWEKDRPYTFLSPPHPTYTQVLQHILSSYCFNVFLYMKVLLMYNIFLIHPNTLFKHTHSTFVIPYGWCQTAWAQMKH